MTESGDNDQLAAAGLADRLRRALIGKNRAELLNRAGVSDRTVSRILAGHPARYGTLSSIAEALSVSRHWLIEGVGSMEYPAVGSVTSDGLVVERGPFMPLPEATPAPAPSEPTAPDLLDIVNRTRMELVFATIEKREPHASLRTKVLHELAFYDLITKLGEKEAFRLLENPPTL